MVIAIDGPAGAGKSTVARRLAARLGGAYLNTGAMYRAVALLALRERIDLDDGPALAAAARAHEVRLVTGAGSERVLLDGDDVTDRIRSPEVGAAASTVSAHGELRQVIVGQQQRILESGVWVADGRDIGTVVAPEAEVKIFLTADPLVRAQRRHDELVAGGRDSSFDDVLHEITGRDESDAARSESPMAVAPGAHVVDTSTLDIDEVTDLLARLVAQTVGGQP